jgi:1-aminocyclopropane-1-carboxylate deaminase
VIGIDASATPEQTRTQVLAIAQHTASLVGLGQEITADDVLLREEYAYPAYGIPSEETNAAIRLCARMEGMMTDPVYEGNHARPHGSVRKDFFPGNSSMHISAACQRLARIATFMKRLTSRNGRKPHYELDY